MNSDSNSIYMMPLVTVSNHHFTISSQIGLGSIFGAFISGVTALIILLLGLFIERRKSKNKEFRNLSTFNEYLSFQVNNLSISAIKQRDEIMKFLKKMKQDIEQDYFLKLVSSFNPKTIEEIINADLFKLLILKRTKSKNDNIEKYSHFVNSITLLSNLKLSIYDYFKDFNSKNQLYINNYKSHLEKVVRTMEDFGTYAEQNNIKKGDDIFLDRYNEILNKLIKDEDYQDIHKTYKNLVIPFHNLCSDKRIVRGDIRANIVVKEILQAKYYFESYLKLKSFYMKEFCATAKLINKQIIRLKESYKDLNNNKLLK